MSRFRQPPIRLALYLSVVLSAWPVSGYCARVDISEELERLMAVHGFTMRDGDIEAVRGAVGRAQGDDLVPRLRTLLEGFDYIIVQRPDGAVDRLLILGEKAAYVPPEPMVVEGDGEEAGDETQGNGEIVLETRRQGASHVVNLGLEGGGGKRMQSALLLDTGADYVVLPASLIPRLGIAPDQLRTQMVQTANGKAEAQLGELNAVWLGERRVEGVDAAFIDDAQLGGSGLLGMSVLGRFRVTIDDEHNRVVLVDK